MSRRQHHLGSNGHAGLFLSKARGVVWCVKQGDKSRDGTVGDLYIPKSLDCSKKAPAIVVGPPFGGVREQTAGLAPVSHLIIEIER